MTYRYNPVRCQYEPVYLTGKRLLKKLLLFFAISFSIAFTCFFWYIDRHGPFEEQILQKRNQVLKAKWDALQERVDQSYNQLNGFIDKDDNNYRIFLDLEPLSPDQREAGVGGSEPFYLAEVKNFQLVVEGYERLEKLKHQVDVEKQSYKALSQTADIKLSMWASRPAIQPIHNKELKRLYTTFGWRFHPILKYFRDHNGLDLAALHGTPVYATGNGTVSRSDYSETYGFVIYIDHGFGFETRYAHLSKFLVTTGEHIKRGQLLGYVGSSGLSKSPHLHYEVLNQGIPVNPINFFQRDLNNAEFQKLIDQVKK